MTASFRAIAVEPSNKAEGSAPGLKETEVVLWVESSFLE